MACIVDKCGQAGVSAYKLTGAIVCPIHMRMGCPGASNIDVSGWSSEMNRAHKLREDMRSLWFTHATETRMFIVATVSNLHIAGQTLSALLKNQKDIGGAIGQFYGDEIGKVVTDLLTEHIVIAGKIVTAVIEKQAIDGPDGLWNKWIENAEAISEKISGLNEDALPYDDVYTLMEDHLNSTKAELLAYVAKSTDDSYQRAVEKVYECVLNLSDALSAGIASDLATRTEDED